MRAKNGNRGYTLVELIVAIAVGSIVTLAATTILLFGLRANGQSIGTATRQNTARVILTALEDLATEGTITGVKSEPDSWIIGDIAQEGNGDAGELKFNTVYYSYNSAKQTIYTGESTPILENVISSFVTLDSKGLLSIYIETEDGSYSSSVYCRTSVSSETSDVAGETNVKDYAEAEKNETNTTVDGRTKFLQVLATQYRLAGGAANPGLILTSSGYSTGKYYSEWYIDGYENNPGWNKDTPWCACFVSWGLGQVESYLPKDEDNKVPKQANVDSFVSYLKSDTNSHKWQDSKAAGGTIDPEAGDLIFFDWEIDAVYDAQHVGVVLALSENKDYVYTIEGNSSGIVAVRKYALTDLRIMGYGVLDWKTN